MKLPVIILSVLMSVSLPSCSELWPFGTEPTVPETEPTVATTEAPTVATTAPLLTGWVEEYGRRYYYDENGIPLTGWQELDGDRYYFLEDGSMATGEVQIGEAVFHFTSQGKRIVMVNPWNSIPYDYVLDLVPLDRSCGVEGSRVHRDCYEDLVAMITDCNKECPQAMVVSAYRSHEQQTNNYNNKVKFYVNQGYSQEDAEREAAKVIAIPGTSEHQLGLAVDVIDTRFWALEEEQADLPAQQWLMENCWKYGFILRYPADKTHVTGIIYEPWHYRYVGKELAAELHELGITLEEYIQSLTPNAKG